VRAAKTLFVQLGIDRRGALADLGWEPLQFRLGDAECFRRLSHFVPFGQAMRDLAGGPLWRNRLPRFHPAVILDVEPALWRAYRTW